MSWILAARVLGWGDSLEVSPVTGRTRICLPHNDVWNVLEQLGGPETVASRFNLHVRQIHQWIDDHFVPTEFAEEIKALTGWSKWSMQYPPFSFVDCQEAIRLEEAEDMERERQKRMKPAKRGTRR